MIRDVDPLRDDQWERLGGLFLVGVPANGGRSVHGPVRGWLTLGKVARVCRRPTR